MSLTLGLLVARIVILLMTLSSCTNATFDHPATYGIERLNNYISFALLVGYTFSLVKNHRFVTPYTRAFIMILFAFIWFSSNMTWSLSRHLRGRDSRIMNVTVSLPTSILIVIESILTLKWEARKRREEELIKASQEQVMLSVALIRGTGGMAGSISNENIGLLPRANMLPPDEQDNVEVAMPENMSTENKTNAYQRPEQAYFPVLPGRGQSSSSSSSSSHHSHRQQLHTQMYNNNNANTEPDSEQLPPYSRV
ncbi:hypothetical protein EDD21DRAFT_383852 [Dissophora ornata]|nr:hypothetical protein EDD21DRAFT_383852 [Dissophora ornata]